MELRVKKVQNQLMKGQRPYQMKTQDTWRHTQNYPVEYFNTRRRSVEQECKGKLLRKQDNVACSTNEIGSKTTLEEQNIFNAVGIASNDKSNTFIGLKHDQISIIVQIFEIVKKKVWVNCYCWGNSSMVEGRFPKWFWSVKKGVLNLFLSISMAYNVISCQKVAENTQILKIAKFAM